MNFVRLVFLPTVFSLLVSCGARSLYNSSHYGDTRLGDDLFRVTFRGGEHPMSGELCLLRCAELCRESDTPTLRSWTRRPEVPCAMLHRSIPFIVTIIRTILFFRHSFVAKTIRYAILLWKVALPTRLAKSRLRSKGSTK